MPPLFRADHIGSLLRPTHLKDIVQSIAFYDKVTSSSDLAAISEGIHYIVKEQMTLSIRPVTNGEYDRRLFFAGFFENLAGMETLYDMSIETGSFREGLPHLVGMSRLGQTTWPTWVTTSKIKHVEPCFLDSWEMLKQAVPPEQWKDCKFTLPPVTCQHLHMKRGTAYHSDVYASDEEYFTDLIAAYRKEVLTLYDAGLRSIQVDDPLCTFFLIDEFWKGLEKDGVDPEELLALYVWAHNECLKDLPKDLHMSIHICRGNAPKNLLEEFGTHESYEKIAEKVFGGLKYHTMYIQADEADLQPLRFVPRGTNIILGVVDTKTPNLEKVEELEARVRAATDVIAKGQGREVKEVLEDSIGVSPTCGFCSVIHFDGMGGEKRMWEKLGLVQNLAERIWPEMSSKL